MRRGDIFFVNLPSPPSSQGREQAGQRPAIVVSSDQRQLENPMVMVVPFTSQLNALRFPYSIQVDPSPENGLSLPSVAMVFQLLALDKSRLFRRIGHLEAIYQEQISQMMKLMLDLNS